jgi:RNA polymerase sigma-70 factor, ECF subfamily
VTGVSALWKLAFEVGYRMLGSRSDAEDIAQEALLRSAGPIEHGEVRNPEAFVTTVATRLAIDHLRAARARREVYVGPWLPEPLIDSSDSPQDLPDSLSYGLLVVLETLGPVERAAFLLHDVFGVRYKELARTLERSEPACRQLVARARRRVAIGRPRMPVDPVAHRNLLERFIIAATEGDLEGLIALLGADVVLVTDGGGKARAFRHPIRGRTRVARLMCKVCPAWMSGEVKVVAINGEPGFLVELSESVYVAGTIEVKDQQITALRWIRNPDKLPSCR